MLTKRDFKVYSETLDRLERLRAEGTMVADTVRGSSPEPPYTMHTMTIKGFGPRKKKELERLEAKCAEIEAAIALAPESVRKMLIARYAKGLAWAQVGEQLGMKPDACRVAVHRYLDKL